jgi:hypothetical protein
MVVPVMIMPFVIMVVMIMPMAVPAAGAKAQQQAADDYDANHCIFSD